MNHTAEAEARGYAQAASSLEKEDPQRASELYTECAKLYKQIANDPETDNPEYYMQRADDYLDLSKRVMPRSINEGNVKSIKDELVMAQIPDISFADIGGLEDVKQEIRKAIIYPFSHKHIYDYYGKTAGQGILMYGPPGCGKTMMAKAAAHESGAAFINVRTSTIMSRYVGESEQHIKEVFEAAREHEKAIIFFDEIDSIASRRSESEDYIKRVVNELLTQLDGVDTSNDNFLVIAATNTPWLIDPAFRRPGRFNKLLLIPEPDQPAREAILSNNFKNKPFTGIHAADIAAMTAGYSGADLTALCEDALDLPLHEALSTGNTRPVNMGDIMQALDGRQSSTRSWYIEADRELEKYGEKDIFTF